MKWLEIIELRLSVREAELAMLEIEMLVEKINNQDIRNPVNLYIHANVRTDFSIHIMHDTENIEKNGSFLGLNIASSLKEFGLINHNVWIQEHPEKTEGG